MDPEPHPPSIRELIAEYAALEERFRSIEADVIGGATPRLDPELARLAERERQILAMLRHHHARDDQDAARSAR